jgi:transglutaminase-like putative cysteine protease
MRIGPLSFAVHLTIAAVATAHESPPESRRFLFTYAATIDGLEPGTNARVWLPVAPTDDDQEVELVAIDVPGEYQRNIEPKFGNELLFFEAPADEAGQIALRIDYRLTRRAATPVGTPADAGDERSFLAGSSLVPVDGTVTKRLFDGRPPRGTARQIARSIYERVDDHLRYDKTGEGWGRGDVLWACDARRGNCSDFHSLFIALCRDLSVPAKFEIGFPLPTNENQGEIAGYHCWAKFLDGDRWIGVDVSEADKHADRKEFFFGNLPPDRVMFSTERDLELVPKQAAGPVNFLIYPYVEVEGKPHAKQSRRFTFEDLP